MNSQATSISKEKMPASNDTWKAWMRRNRIAIAIISLLGLALVGFIYWQTTYVSGVEFNARTFSTRSFSFRRDPFTNAQWTGVVHGPGPENTVWTAAAFSSTIDPVIGRTLNPINSQDRWDLVSFDRSFQSDEPAILIDLLSLHDSSYRMKWPAWTTDHPKQAALFWPLVQALAGLKLYARLPDVFEVPLLELDGPEFVKALFDRVQTVLIDEATLYLKSDQAEKANELVQFGLKLRPNDELRNLIRSPQAEAESF